MAYDLSLGKQVRIFGLFFSYAERKKKISRKSEVTGPVPQVSGRLCEAKPEAKTPRSDTQCKSDMGGRRMIKLKYNFEGFRAKRAL